MQEVFWEPILAPVEKAPLKAGIYGSGHYECFPPHSFTNLDLGDGFPRAGRKDKDLSEDFGPEP